MNPLPGVPLTPDGRFHLFGAAHPLEKASRAFLLRAASATLLAEALVVSAISLTLLANRAAPPAPAPDTRGAERTREMIMPPPPSIAKGFGGVKIQDPTRGGRTTAEVFARVKSVEDLLADQRTIASMDDAMKPVNPDAIEGGGDGIFGGSGFQGVSADSLSNVRFVMADDQPFDHAEVMPRYVKQVAPEYPRAARDAGLEGTVLVRAWIGVDGRVKQTRVLSGPEALAPAAERAVAQCVFTPARNGGRPVQVWVAVPIRFVLRD